MEYKINDDDLKILISQTNISKNEGRKLLIKNNGDISKCILQSFDYQEKTETVNENQDETKKKLLEFRKILDEKDTLFCQMIENNKKNKKA